MTFLLCLSSLNGPAANQQMENVLNLLHIVFTAISGEISAQVWVIVCTYTPIALQIGAYMLLAVLLWNALRCTGLRTRHAIVLALATSSLFAVIDELLQLSVAGRLPRITDWVIDFASAGCILGGIWLFGWAQRRFPKLLNRETISYVIFGVLTTIVNIVIYMLSCNLWGIPNLVSNIIAWVFAVLFAYIVNKLFVFQSETSGFYEASCEFLLFISARLFSLGVDELGMWIMVDLLDVNGLFSKFSMNVVVMVINYFFSKWFIFNQHAPEPDTNES